MDPYVNLANVAEVVHVDCQTVSCRGRIEVTVWQCGCKTSTLVIKHQNMCERADTLRAKYTHDCGGQNCKVPGRQT